MAKNPYSETYASLLRQIFLTAAKTGEYISDPMPKAAAQALRFQLYAWRKGQPQEQVQDLLDLTITLPDAGALYPGYHCLRVAGPLWANSQALAAIRKGLDPTLTPSPAPGTLNLDDFIPGGLPASDEPQD